MCLWAGMSFSLFPVINTSVISILIPTSLSIYAQVSPGKEPKREISSLCWIWLVPAHESLLFNFQNFVNWFLNTDIINN